MAWELIGDQNASTDIANNKVAVGSFDAVASRGVGFTLSLSNNGANHFAAVQVSAVTSFDNVNVDDSSGQDYVGDNLVTASAVTAYVSSQLTDLGLGTAATADVLTFEIGGAMGDENWASKYSSSDLPTASQVYSLVSEKIGAIDADAVAFDYKNDP